MVAHPTDALPRAALDHIPFANPFVTKLAGLATTVIRDHDCELVLACYYEPYAVAGWLASRWTGRPLCIRHAGSDLARLMRVPALGAAYREILRSAEVVLTWPPLRDRFLALGVDTGRLEDDVRYPIATGVFHPGAPALDLGLAGARPRIGIYGKIGETKGTYDLLAALAELARELDFDLLALVGTAQGEKLIAAAPTLAGRLHVLPLLPNWKVPSFLRACDAVCALERGFSVAMHGPLVPSEVLASGVCLVLSRELADKEDAALVADENVLIVEDPRDRRALAAVLRRIIENPAEARAIGARGASLARAAADLSGFAARWEAILLRARASN